jgi:hypothetical protein
MQVSLVASSQQPVSTMKTAESATLADFADQDNNSVAGVIVLI